VTLALPLYASSRCHFTLQGTIIIVTLPVGLQSWKHRFAKQWVFRHEIRNRLSFRSERRIEPIGPPVAKLACGRWRGPFEAGIIAAIGALNPMPWTTEGLLQMFFLQGYASNLELCANLCFQHAPAPESQVIEKPSQPVQTYGSNPANL
jgi:hypothetical protein